MKWNGITHIRKNHILRSPKNWASLMNKNNNSYKGIGVPILEIRMNKYFMKYIKVPEALF